MKKRTIFAAVLAVAIAGGVFAEEYTIHVAGTFKGTVTVQKEQGGKITITSNITGNGWDSLWLGKTICPLLPEYGIIFTEYTLSCVIDGNTTTYTNTKGYWGKTVIDGNTTTVTTSEGNWTKTVIDGNTMIRTSSNGALTKLVIDGNTLTTTYFNPDSSFRWVRETVTEKTITTTSSVDTSPIRTEEIKGNTTTGITRVRRYQEVINGNTRTWTYTDASYGYDFGYKEVVDKDTITRTFFGNNRKGNSLVVLKQGYDIFITITTPDSFYSTDFYYIGMSEKDRVQRSIDGIKSGKPKPWMLEYHGSI